MFVFFDARGRDVGVVDGNDVVSVYGRGRSRCRVGKRSELWERRTGDAFEADKPIDCPEKASRAASPNDLPQIYLDGCQDRRSLGVSHASEPSVERRLRGVDVT